MTEERLLTTADVAVRLGVKRATVYAYVSRGLLRSKRNGNGKESLFAESDVAAFAAERRRPVGAPDAAPIHTGITLIADGTLYFRGHLAGDLARTHSFESVASLLWTSELRHARLRPDPAMRELAAAVTLPLPPGTRLTDRLRVIVAACAAVDPLCFDITPAAVVATGRTLLDTMVAALPVLGADHPRVIAMVPAAAELPGEWVDPESSPADLRGSAGEWGGPETSPVAPSGSAGEWGGSETSPVAPSGSAGEWGGSETSPVAPGGSAGEWVDPESSPTDLRGALSEWVGPESSATGPRGSVGEFPLASMLWGRLTELPLSEERVRVLNAALVLLADHDLAASTFAARVAASTRAHPYAVVGAGLAALDGPLHGAASSVAGEVLAAAVRTGDPLATIGARLRAEGRVPGFGLAQYPHGDPRAAVLLELVGGIVDDGSRAVWEVVTAVAEAVEQRSGARPDIDFALAAFGLVSGMVADAGEAIFAVARTAGWLAHALEEYADQPSRFRPSGRYSGRLPG